ncbi:MAG: hypothetical protein H9Q65_05625 [Spiroplasma ixodetis]|nr:hypothetical protein [Spiroplasma ixodetis]
MLEVSDLTSALTTVSLVVFDSQLGTLKLRWMKFSSCDFSTSSSNFPVKMQHHRKFQ